ncbi:MAG TPA: hypothetical protein VEW46_06570 [Pyrinomonadaceae bacterium]|nr:hypothetical protein [Pyrinomonadaceae bacterium]
MTIQNTDQTKRELRAGDGQTAKRPFIEPEISEPVNVLEATAFFQVIVGDTNVSPNLTG